MSRYGYGYGIDSSKKIGGSYAYLDNYGTDDVAIFPFLVYSNYSGPLFTIRRDNDDAEKAFYPDSNNWISLASEDGSGTSLGTWIGSNNGFIKTAHDQGSGGIDVSNTNKSQQPKIVDSGSMVLFNSLASMYFDGGDSLLKSIAILKGEFLAICVASNDNDENAGGVFNSLDLSSATSRIAMFIDTRASNKINSNYAAGGSGNLLVNLADSNNNTYYLNSLQKSGNTVSAFQNSIIQDTLDASGIVVGDLDSLYVGLQNQGSVFLEGYIGGIFISDDNSNISNRAAIENIIKNHFNLSY